MKVELNEVQKLQKIAGILKEEYDIENKLKQYLNTDVHSGDSVNLSSIFNGIDIDKLIKDNPKQYTIPSKYTPANMYFWRGFSLPLDQVKKLGPFKDKEIIKNNEYIVSYDKKFTNPGIQSFTALEKVAIGFAEYSSNYADEKSFETKTSNIPVLIAVEYSKYKNDFFGNPEYLAKIGKHGNEGEVFFKGNNYVADVFIPSYVKKYLK